MSKHAYRSMHLAVLVVLATLVVPGLGLAQAPAAAPSPTPTTTQAAAQTSAPTVPAPPAAPAQSPASASVPAPTEAPPCAPCVEKKPQPKKVMVRPKPPEWGYEGANGPEHWGKLHSQYKLCDSGVSQSPIDLRNGIGVDVPPPRFDYRPSRFTVANDGHGLKVALTSPGTMTFAGKTYRLSEIHFHRPGEERIDGKTFQMGAHLVHKDSKGALGVVAVLITVGKEHPTLQAIWNHIPLGKGQSMASAADVLIDLSGLFPRDRAIFHYSGSLTTPPCTEGVEWVVFKEPVEASPEQLSIYARLFPENARPIQAANGRLIKESRAPVR